MMATVHPDYEVISKVYAMIQNIGNDLQIKFAVSFEQVRILHFISSIQPKEMTVSILSKEFRPNTSATSRKVSALYKQNLIKDHVSGDDRRTHWITLTPKGISTINELKEFVDDYLPEIEKQIIATLSKNMTDLI